VTGTEAACSMNQGDGEAYCEYKCSQDSDCPSGAVCEKNIVASICTYVSSPTPTPYSFGPPPCNAGEYEIFPAKCGKTPTGPPAGLAEGSYCSTKCTYNDASTCPSVSGTDAACTMNQGDGEAYCEYKCSQDVDCPSGAVCEKNIASSICTYVTPTPPSPPTPPTPGPSPQPYGLSFRVAKGLGSRGYEKLRVSCVRYAGEADVTERLNDGLGVSWSYDAQFQKRWTNFHLSSAVVEVSPGQVSNLNLDGYSVQVKIPTPSQGTVGVLIGDPCIHYDSTWCKYGSVFQTKTTLQGVLNSLAAHDELDWWAVVGDLFYDQGGSLTTDFFSGLSMSVAGKPLMVTMGNHDYWINGSPGSSQSGDSYANGHMQWYAQDAVSASSASNPFDFSANPDWGQVAAIGNTFWYHAIGNVAFIGFSNAYDWGSSYSHFVDACAWVETQQPELVVLMGHWNGVNLGCASGMDTDDVYGKVAALPGCSSLGSRLKYIEGHKHCNYVTKSNTGFLLGSFGFEDGDGSCSGAFGIPVLDTRNGVAKLYYYELGEHGYKTGNFDAILACFRDNGLSGCTQYAQVWMSETLSRDNRTVLV